MFPNSWESDCLGFNCEDIKKSGKWVINLKACYEARSSPGNTNPGSKTVLVFEGRVQMPEENW